MKKLMSSLNKRSSALVGGGDSSSAPAPDSPQANVARGIRLFCESGGPNNSNGQGEEVLHLPVIVEAAESSPEAARDAANVIRKFLSKDNNKRPYVQYNAIMLIRILSDNPGKTFTRNLDGKFIVTVKDLFRTSADPSVLQMLSETLTDLGKRKDDEGLVAMNEFWAKEQEKQRSMWPQQQNGQYQVPPPPPGGPPNQQSNYFARPHKVRGLPPPDELAARIEEAKTSAKLLQQVVRSTPANEILQNDLVKEFAERCQSASRSIQGYINAQNPAPDDDTLLTLIETNDQLSSAMSKHQRALLNARKQLTGSPAQSPPPTIPNPQQQEQANPFADSNQEPTSRLQAPIQPTPAASYGTAQPVAGDRDIAAAPTPPPAAQTHTHEPFNPGFGGQQYQQPQGYQQQQYPAPSGPPPVPQHPLQGQPQFNSTPSGPPPVPQNPPQGQPQFNSTPSYSTRQHEALQGESMHGAAAAQQHSPVSPVQPSPAREPAHAQQQQPAEPIAYRY